MTVFAFVLDPSRAVVARYRNDIHTTLPPEAIAVSEAVWNASLEMPYPKLALDGSLSNVPPAYNIAAHRAQAKSMIAAVAGSAQATASRHLDPVALFAVIAEIVEWKIRINPQPEKFPMLNAEAAARSIAIPDLIDELDELDDMVERYAAIHGARAKAIKDIDAASTESAINAAIAAATTLIRSL